MRYFGSKVSVVEDIYKLIYEKIPSGSFCDPFGGIGTVGSFFKNKDYKIYSGDHLTFAHFFQIARIAQNEQPKFQDLCENLQVDGCKDVLDILNSIEGTEGWFVENYAYKRKYFTPENGRKIEACWSAIEKWNHQELLSYEENAILLASLINSIDKVSNTAGTYYAYLKNWHEKALRPFKFKLLEFTQGCPLCKCFLCEAKNLVEKQKYDILYLDPPYNERSYASYYHLPETIALNERPEVYGKSGVPHSQRPISAFNRVKGAIEALDSLLSVANYRLLVFHYSDGGIIPTDTLSYKLKNFGSVEEYVIEADGYINRPKSRKTKHRLYLVEA